MRKVLIVGATSAIAEATARLLAQRGDQLFLVSRNHARLEAIAADLKVRGCSRVEFYVMAADDFDAHSPMLDAANLALGGLETALIAHGTLSDQKACERSVNLTMADIRTNALSVVALLTELANRFEQQGRGTIAVISSVAGDRGRQSNYVYGSAKAMVTVFLSGLGQRLAKSNVAVVTIKPGFVDTPMTKHISGKGFLWSTPARIAAIVLRAMDRKQGVVYAPGFWRPIMLAIRSLPDGVFRRLSI